jgi:hypothetical protein
MTPPKTPPARKATLSRPMTRQLLGLPGRKNLLPDEGEALLMAGDLEGAFDDCCF